MNKELLKTVIADQTLYGKPAEWTVPRNFPDPWLQTDETVIISGVRRCGKSVLLQQIRSRQKEQDYYLNFDDERLMNFTVAEFQMLYELFIELFGEQHTFYFDEIQNIAGWERFVRRLHDSGNRIYITGSNATMLSRELGTHLTGRYLRFELYPFSFGEYIAWKDRALLDKDPARTAVKSQIKALFNTYLTGGGFPTYVKTDDRTVLKYLFESILYRDVMVRNRLTNEREIQELIFYLASNCARLSSYNSLASVIGVKNATTVKNYLSFVQDSYLLFQINKYDFSTKKQLFNPKKTYWIDNGLVRMLGFGFSDNMGQLLENLVFIELKRRNRSLYYHSQKRECDFVVVENMKVTEAIQVCLAFESEKTKNREIEGLMDAMTAYDLPSGLIITRDTEESLRVEGRQIDIVPAWKWLLK
jgi:predicted AAA+ superfamily ATPase